MTTQMLTPVLACGYAALFREAQVNGNPERSFRPTFRRTVAAPGGDTRTALRSDKY